MTSSASEGRPEAARQLAAKHLQRAREHISEGTSESLRYAALNLRFCMELLTYEQLRAVGDLVPEGVLSTWQPPQAVRALIEFQPMADQSFKLDFGTLPVDTPVEQQQWASIGERKTFDRRWLAKHYNKVGNLLHAPMSPELGDALKTGTDTYLKDVLDEIELVLQSSITAFAERGGFSFKCQLCGSLIVRNAKAMEMGQPATCFKKECAAQYRLAGKSVDGAPSFQLLAVQFPCSSCQVPIHLPLHRVTPHQRFQCTGCRTWHTIDRFAASPVA